MNETCEDSSIEVSRPMTSTENLKKFGFSFERTLQFILPCGCYCNQSIECFSWHLLFKDQRTSVLKWCWRLNEWNKCQSTSLKMFTVNRSKTIWRKRPSLDFGNGFVICKMQIFCFSMDYYIANVLVLIWKLDIESTVACFRYAIDRLFRLMNFDLNCKPLKRKWPT